MMTDDGRVARIVRLGLNRGTTAIGPTLDRLVPPWRSALTTGLTVFVFHEITDAPSPFHREHATYTSPGVFGRQLDWITKRFTVVPPVKLPQLGGAGGLPSNAALLTFDDSWAGTVRVGLPILRDRNLAALWFLNMATVWGDPDLAAVRAYDARVPDGVGFARLASISLEQAGGILDGIRERYADDPVFRAYQGPTAEPADLDAAAGAGGAWFGSHLFHHWNLRSVDDNLYEQSLAENAAALGPYPNAVSAFAPPHGYAGEDGRDLLTVATRAGVKVMFTGRGTQNAQGEGHVIDRVLLPPEPSTPRGWWHGTHLARLIGPRVR